MQFHFLTKPQLPCADPARQPETPIGTPWQGSGARAASAVPTFHISFPRANPPQKCLTPQPAEPTPPLPTVKGRLLLDSKSTGLSRELMRCPFPQKHRCWTERPLGFARAPTSVTAEMEVLPPILLSREETPKWEIWFVTLSCQNWTYLGGGSDQKGMYFYS